MPSTFSEYQRQVEQRIKPSLGALMLDELRPDHIVRMLDDLRRPGADRRSRTARGLSETSLQHTLSTLRTAPDWGVRHRLVGHNQAKDVDRPQGNDVETKVWKSRRGRRVVDLDPTTVNVLRQWRRHQEEEREAWGIAYVDSGMVFTAEDGQAFHADRMAQAFDRFDRRRAPGRPVDG